MKLQALPLVLALAALAACGGGGGSGTSGSLPASAPTPSPSPTSRSSASVAGSVVMVIPVRTAAMHSSSRSAQFISPSASSANITTNTTQVGTFDVSATSTYCVTAGTSRTCTLPIFAPAGSVVIGVSLSNLTGAVLGTGSTTVSVTQGQPFSASVVVDPIVGSVTNPVVTYGTGSSFAVGTAGTATFSFTVNDPGMNVIPATPASTFAGPLTFTSSDTHVAVTPASWTATGQTLTLTYDGSSAVASSVVITVYNGTSQVGAFTITLAGTVTEQLYPVPTASAKPQTIIAGPDGALWFTEAVGNNIGRITTSGTVTNEYPIPTVNCAPAGIAVGSDGNLWFTEENPGANKIGRITPTGTITEFAGLSVAGLPYEIAAGSDNNLWFTEYDGNKIGRITTAGVITEFTVPTASSYPNDIAAGPDGALWFTENGANKIGRITTAGAFTEYPIPTAASSPEGITSNTADGALWFTESAVNKIGRITTTGSITEYTIATPNTQPVGIAADTDGSVWIAEGNNGIGHMSEAGVSIANYAVSPANSQPFSITLGPDGAFWFTENSFTADNIGRIH